MVFFVSYHVGGRVEQVGRLSLLGKSRLQTGCIKIGEKVSTEEATKVSSVLTFSCDAHHFSEGVATNQPPSLSPLT